MNFLVILPFMLACAHASEIRLVPGAISLVGPGELGAIIQGPSAAAKVAGPDGSAIVGTAVGGTVVAPPKSGGLVTAAVSPRIIAPIVPVVPRVALSGAPPAVIAARPGLIAAPPTLIAASPALVAPVPVPALGGIVAGPSGTLITGGLGIGATKVTRGLY